MREIKFRAWDKYEKRMLSWDHLRGIRYNLSWYKDNKKLDKINDLWTDSQYILMQYIGIKDKDGIEIYEGDIVESSLDDDTEIAEISFSPHSGYAPDHGMAFDNSWIDHLIVGNIHENQDLLNRNIK